jgi:hypothetical protein
MTSPFLGIRENTLCEAGLLNLRPTSNLEGLDFISEFIPLGTRFVWFLHWGLSGLDNPAGSHTTAGIAPSLEVGRNVLGTVL